MALDPTGPSKQPERWRTAREALRARDFAAAIPLLRAICHADDADLRAQFLLGSALAATDEHDEAKRVLKRLLEHDRDNASAWFNLARIYGLSGRRHRMRQCLRRALKADPNHAKARRAALHHGIRIPGADMAPDVHLPLGDVEFPTVELDAAEPTPARLAEAAVRAPWELAAPEARPPEDDGEADEAPPLGPERWQCDRVSVLPLADLGWRYGLLLGIAAGLVGSGLALADYAWTTSLAVAASGVVGGLLVGLLAALLGAAGANVSTFITRGVIVDVRREGQWIEVLRLEAGPWAWTSGVAAVIGLLLLAGAAALAAALLPAEMGSRLAEALGPLRDLPGGVSAAGGAALAIVVAVQALLAAVYNAITPWTGGLLLLLHAREARHRFCRVAIGRSFWAQTITGWIATAPAAVAAVCLAASDPGRALGLAIGLWLVLVPAAVTALTALYNAVCDQVRGLEVQAHAREMPGRLMVHAAFAPPPWRADEE